eukprot:2145139-Amphidinium_carterae.3
MGWIPPTRRIGEAKTPGTSICSANPGGWSRIDGTLNLKHDIVAVQETFVLREQVSSTKYTAYKLGYYSSFTPARKTDGRPSGGLALLCRQAQPLQRLEKGTHWEQGRWAHHLLPFEGGLHVFNVYGYSSDKDRAHELNREVCLEIFAVAALGNRQIFILGHWNFEPDNFPIDLLNGGQVNRPLSAELQIDWILCSEVFLPACGMELETGKKPDHVAISLDFSGLIWCPRATEGRKATRLPNALLSKRWEWSTVELDKLTLHAGVPLWPRKMWITCGTSGVVRLAWSTGAQSRTSSAWQAAVA